MIATTRCKGGREQVREYLIEACEKASLTQQDVANRIGISRQYYQMVETGERQKHGLVPCGRSVGGSEYSDC